ncbi:MAG: hypothetical protein ACYCXG_11635 [Acidiferrobacter sp.]
MHQVMGLVWAHEIHTEGVAGRPLTIHQGNGSPMEGSTYLVKLNELGITASYSRPGISDDNACAESLFRTCKYHPAYPGTFASLRRRKRGCSPSCAGITMSTSTAI